MDRHDYRLILLLAGVHALTRQQIANLRLDELDLTGNKFHVGGRPRPLDRLTKEHLLEWLHFRRTRWPHTSNPYLLVTVQSANRVVPVGKTFLQTAFASLPVTASDLRVDRLVSAAHESRGDALRIALLFGMSSQTATNYANSFGPFDGEQTLQLEEL